MKTSNSSERGIKVSANCECFVLYVAGHGGGTDKGSWLAPTNVDVNNLEGSTIGLQQFVSSARALGGLQRLFILDTHLRHEGSSSPPLELERNECVVHSCSPGEKASDGSAGKGSDFSRSMVEHIKKGESLLQTLQAMKLGENQTPWITGSIGVANAPFKSVADEGK